MTRITRPINALAIAACSALLITGAAASAEAKPIPTPAKHAVVVHAPLKKTAAHTVDLSSYTGKAMLVFWEEPKYISKHVASWPESAVGVVGYGTVTSMSVDPYLDDTSDPKFTRVILGYQEICGHPYRLAVYPVGTPYWNIGATGPLTAKDHGKSLEIPVPVLTYKATPCGIY